MSSESQDNNCPHISPSQAQDHIPTELCNGDHFQKEVDSPLVNGNGEDSVEEESSETDTESNSSVVYMNGTTTTTDTTVTVSSEVSCSTEPLSVKSESLSVKPGSPSGKPQKLLKEAKANTSPLASPKVRIVNGSSPEKMQTPNGSPGAKRPYQALNSGSIVHQHLEQQATSPKHIATPSGELTVPLFYRGKGVLITGATGFIGKVLVEKLLRCCPDLDCVYCLIRPKNKQTIENRLEEITSSKLFDRLRKERPNFAKQLRPVCGDMLLPDLGLSESDRHMLEQNVNIVFHNAATIRFDEPLRVAVEMNVVAVRKMLALCRNFELLEAFVHVSTAYANCDRPYIEETVYPPPVEPQKIIDVLEWMDDEMLELFTPKLMGEKPNTYTYTKQLAEHLLITEGADLPLAIIRPSIVGAAWKEPFPGWIDNYNGPSGIYIAAGRGILRSMKGESNAIADIVPVDIPVNIMITVGWYTAVAKPKNVMVYHATTGGANPFTWGDMSGIVNKSFKHTPLEGCFRRPNVAIVSNSFLHDYWTCVSHLFPAYIIDIAYRLMGRKPRMVKLYNKLHRSIEILKFFTCNEWQWANSNHDMLKHQLTPADVKMFYFDPLPLHWPTYIENYCLGAKKYVLNEDLSGLPAARAHIRKLRIIRYVFNSVVAVILWRVLIAKSQFARNLWFFIVGLVFKFVQYFRITSTMQKS